jgi:ubiquinone/menaquinone biosynthesis C-methylase UbiE
MDKVWSSSSIASKYAAAERGIIPAAQRLIDLSGVLTVCSPRVIFDNACGTGLVTSLLHKAGENPVRPDQDRIVMGDISESMIESVKERISLTPWPVTEAQVVDAQNTKLLSDHFTHVLVNFGIMLLPKPFDALNGAKRGVCMSSWRI